MENLAYKLEGLLFVSGDGVEIPLILEKWQITEKQLDEAVEELKKKYPENEGIKIIKYNNKLQFCSNSEFADDISLVLNPIRERALSKATLETIAIIAYKQPITRLEIENVRGVNSDYAIQTLLKHNLIEVVGRKDAVGKPLLFGTTDDFLKRFNLENLSELPNYDELLNSIQVINNKALYNEFDIPDEETSTDENIEEQNTPEQVEEIKTNEIVESQEKLQNEDIKTQEVDLSILTSENENKNETAN